MRTELLDYPLPERLIARYPLSERSAARLMVVDEPIGHASVRDLPELLPEGALLVVNDTRVINARLLGHKPTGGKVELLLVRRLAAEADGSERWAALGRSSRPLRDGTEIDVGGGLRVRVERQRGEEELLQVRLWSRSGDAVLEAVERLGRVPLPPYLARPDAPEDRQRYQTVFARVPGAVAAPTAGLHFDPELLASLEARGMEIARVTLHVGPGTFRPVAVENLDEHPMHAERYSIGDEAAQRIAAARERGAPVVAVGTTVVRALESAAVEGGAVPAVDDAETRLLIQPGYRFRVIDALVTNFHLPRSTLLALVHAFAGSERARAAYAEAVDREYRFYSYGDAMLIPRCAARAS